MNYLVLSIRLDTYITHRNKGTIEVETETRGQSREKITLILCTIIIIAIPLSIII